MNDIEEFSRNLNLNKEFEKWLSIKCDKIKFKKISKTLNHFRDNDLLAELKVFKKPAVEVDEALAMTVERQPAAEEYSILIKGKNDENGIEFNFYRHAEAQWRFGIDIEVDIKDGLSLIGLGYSRFMMAIMLYCLDKYIDKPIDLILPGDYLTIGICADASDGFWSNMEMKQGKLSMDGDRHNSKVGSHCGYDLEFTMFDWKRWIFSDNDVKKRSISSSDKSSSNKKKKGKKITETKKNKKNKKNKGKKKGKKKKLTKKN